MPKIEATQYPLARMLEPALRRLLLRLPAEVEVWHRLADAAARGGLPGEMLTALRAMDRARAVAALAASPGDHHLVSLLLDLAGLDRGPPLPADPPGGDGLPARVERRQDRAPMLRVPGLPGVYLDEYPVTVPRYWAFGEATGTPRAYGWRELKRFRDRPAVYLSFADAVAYAAWVGGRLPDTILFEAAAYGDDHRPYPWGHDPPSPLRAAFLAGGEPDPDGYPVVTAHPRGASPSGHQQLIGGVWEYLDDGPGDPDDEDPEPLRLTRGGGWRDGPEQLARGATTRVPDDEAMPDVGFRVAVHLRGERLL